MLLRHLLIVPTLFLALGAEPTMQEARAVLSQNPALLQTPQAQAELQKRGLTTSDVEQKLLNNDSSEKAPEATEKLNENEISDSDKDTTTRDSGSVAKNEKRLNPFRFSSSEKLRSEMRKKQSLFVEKKLTRYSQRFYTNKNIYDASSLPTPPSYIISSGDQLNVYIYGDRDTLYTPTVSSSGTIKLPYIGPVKIGGMSFEDAKKYLQKTLKTHFKMSDFNIEINKYSTIQVTLVGDVKHPGVYNLSSFSTIKDLLLAAKGFSDTTSVREIAIKRGGELVAYIDFYDLLFGGRDFTSQLLKHGDLVVAKSAQTLVSIDGYVNNSAIFELKQNETLKDLLRYAGGMKADASRVNIKVKRFVDNSRIETFEVAFENAKSFTIKNGDSVVVYPLDDSARDNVNIYGNIIRPGNYPIGSIASLNNLLKNVTKNGRKSFFLPETYFEYGVIKRYSSSLEHKIISFNLNEILENKKTIPILPRDEIFIFSHNDIFSSKFVTTKGEVLLKPGKIQFFSGMTLSDAIYASGINSVIDDKIKKELAIYGAMPANVRRAPMAANTSSALNEVILEAEKYLPIGRVSIKLDKDMELLEKSEYNLVLENNDVLIIPNRMDTVSIFGEVFNPTSFVYRKNFDAADYINLASGYTKAADDSRPYIIHTDGTSSLIRKGWWIFSSSTTVVAGDTIVVPICIQENNNLEVWDSVSRIFTSFAMTIATLNVLGLTI